MSRVSWKRGWCLGTAILFLGALVIALLPVSSRAATSACELCILEVQTTGLNSAAEDYIVIGNNTVSDINLSGATIRYITAGGTVNSKTIVLNGLLPAHMVSAFVGGSLQAANPAMTSFPSGLALADDGGTLQIVKANAVLDEVNWGTITKAGFTGTVAPRHLPGASIIRQQLSDGSFVDSGNNATDFVLSTHACTGLSLNEVQPFSIDDAGKDVTPAIEILKSTGASVDQDCSLLLNGQKYSIAAGDLAQGNGLSVIQNVIDMRGQALALPLVADSVNDLQIVSSSYFGQVSEPLMTSGAKLLQPQLLAGQSYAKFSSGWKQTYTPSLGASNKLATTPLTPQVPTNKGLDECDKVVINEILPNPLGDDAGNEWLELKGLSNQPINLAACVVSVNGTLYQYGADVFVNPGELPVYKDFSNGETSRALNLKNSDANTISFGRLNASGTFEPIQTFQYKDAVEGQSWARFEDGWRWTQPTPGLDNATPAGATTNFQPTEFAATSQVVGEQTNVSASDHPRSIQITELFPNPTEPQTDEADEFVELYNTGEEAVDISGYKLEAGSTFAYGYTIPGGSIGPHEYKVFTSGNSSLTLANSAGQVRLLNPAGQVISLSDPYKDAPEGQAWALINGVWVWSANPTPGTANVYLAPAATATAAKAAKKTSAKTATKPKASSAAKKATTKAAKVSSTGKTNTGEETVPLHTPILVGVGASALLYAAYEYRQDILNALYKFRRNRGAGRQARQAT